MYYQTGQFVITKKNSKLSKRANVKGTNNIRLGAKNIIHPKDILRGDIGEITFGSNCIVMDSTTISPPTIKLKKKKDPTSENKAEIIIGDYIFIGEGCTIQAHKIGSFVNIGKNCIIKERCILSDCCMIEDDSVLESDAVVPSFTVYGGDPAVFKGLLVESFSMIMKQKTETYFNRFLEIEAKDIPARPSDGSKSARQDPKMSEKDYISKSDLSESTKIATARDKIN